MTSVPRLIAVVEPAPAEVMAEPDAWPAPPREGPKREQLLEALDAQEPAA